MTVHVSTPESDFFFHSHEIRQILIRGQELTIMLCLPPGIMPDTIKSNNQVDIMCGDLVSAKETIIQAIVNDENITINASRFEVS